VRNDVGRLEKREVLVKIRDYWIYLRDGGARIVLKKECRGSWRDQRSGLDGFGEFEVPCSKVKKGWSGSTAHTEFKTLSLHLYLPRISHANHFSHLRLFEENEGD
jgi:hypothetical protein